MIGREAYQKGYLLRWQRDLWSLPLDEITRFGPDQANIPKVVIGHQVCLDEQLLLEEVSLDDVFSTVLGEGQDIIDGQNNRLVKKEGRRPPV